MCTLYEENIDDMKKKVQLYCRHLKIVVERTDCENCEMHCVHNMHDPQNLGDKRITYEYEVGDTVWTEHGDELKIDAMYMSSRMHGFQYACTVIKGVSLMI